MIKRAFDVSVAAVLLIVFAVPLAVIALVVRWRLGSPVLYVAQRPGLGAKLFPLYKFRTMADKRDESGNLLSDEERMTTLGRMLRATSVDELPELFNVLRGDMSLVGPRPLLPQYIDRYTPEQARRHEVRPGLTGLAQVQGRNAIGWEERLALDVLYVDTRSFLLDLRIIAQTLVKVVKREDVSAPGYATMPEFRGSEED
jgi:sugar transferase EpsL